ncbi:PREDICTED: leucine-rich repeat and calponin homology domain-containing protein 1-like isoform X7 [Priapulus caudatus]|uniref:Leucine-rich repeat and calponin homology domain-containing protein 1-like isoform X7 n=1 Tax=Priapulus caudatus TaxID=37621 RepID=A0ABM1DX92_PRICU|nr:PREDICTED: leucine-rich repeat and calponin homology domain-containing protein 1-like isoform X7 [Priapulus caudatus]
MATTVTGGPQLTRSIERVLEDAQHTGILNITGRKLKEFPKAAAKYDLSDTVLADLSKNRLSEIPEVVCEYWSLESMTCYCNNIRVIPDAVTNLQYLTRLNLSRNQLATLPASLCMLPSLQVLIVSNNKLVSLPEEIGHLTTLMDLDVSCNEISHLPLQLCDIESLAVLNLRKNFLIDLPKDLTRLKLVKLNISENRISQLHPSLIKLMDTLVELVVENNPLISPPALVCNRGRVHIFKCLEIVAVKEAKRHGILTDQDLKQVFRKSRSAQPLSSEDYSRPRQSSEEKRQRNLVASIADSGYITTDSNEDKRWSNESADTNASIEDSRNLALRAMEATKEHWQERGRQQQQQQPPYDASARSRQAIGEQTPIHLVASSPALLDTDERQDEFTKELSRQKAMYEERKKIAEKIKQTIASKSTPPDTPNPPETNGEDPFSKELARQKLLYEEKKQSAEKIRRERAREEEDEREERRRAAVRLQKEQEALIDRQRDEAKRKAEGSSTVAAASPSKTANGTAPVEIRNQEKTTASLVRGSPSRQQQQQQHRVANSRSPVPICTKQLTPEEEFRQKREALVNQTRQQAMLAQRRLEEQRVRMKQIQKDAVLNYVRRTSTSGSPEKELAPSPSPERGFSPQQQLAATMPDSPQQSNLPKSRPAFTPPSTMRAVDGAEPSFTIRRRLDHRDEKQRQMEQLRHNIESRLKVTLPGDLSAALLDGVVLCHLANHIRPRSVQSIHVPSPAVPKLSLAKCRRNVENFVEACRRIGVDEGLLCACDDVVEELSMLRVARTVNALARRPHNITTRDRVLSYVLMLVFLIVCYMLGFHPPG